MEDAFFRIMVLLWVVFLLMLIAATIADAYVPKGDLKTKRIIDNLKEKRNGSSQTNSKL